MGVIGLTSYISDRANAYLKPYELRDCYLVVDGSNVSCQLYKWLSKSHSAFGGDYDEYRAVVKSFFIMLQICNVKPIVLFDGGYEKKKLKTSLRRARATVITLKSFHRGFSPIKHYPILSKQVFWDVMEELKIICIQCDFEADIEIAAVARALDCPVLSYDSDFYIFDVLYIPFSTVHVKPVRYENSNKYYVRCSIYSVDNFLSKFDNLDKSFLPVIATLLGNDYAGSRIFDKFFHHISLPKNKNKSYNQRKIQGVLQWLKSETFNSAVKQILFHLESRVAGKVMKAINASIKDYTNMSVSKSVIEIIKTIKKDVELKENPFKVQLPAEVQRLYCKCKINKFIIDFITLRTYFTALQVEDVVQKESPHLTSLQLIGGIYAMMTPYLRGPSGPLRVYLVIDKKYRAVELKNIVSNNLENVTIDDILKEPEDVRLKWLCCVLEISINDLDIVPKSEWSIFILSFIYWVKKLNKAISLAHIHAMILMAMANQIIQKSTGYFRTYFKFMKGKGHLLNKLKSEEIITKDGKDFTEMLDNVTLHEKLLVYSDLIPFKYSTEKGTGKGYCISTIHLFGSFQSCLLHIMQINALLNYPLPHLRVSDFYSGTLLFNFYLSIKAKAGMERFGLTLFKNAPNLRTVYKYLWERLCEYSEKNSEAVNTPHKKKKKKKSSKKTEETSEEESLFKVCDDDAAQDDDTDYNDENNPYAILAADIKC